ncbi:MAG: tetratricopeptide repeat protein, partial [Cyanobacteria bacterium J06639_18]
MHYKKLFIVAVTTVITTSLESVVLLPGILPTQQVLAQTIEAREAEAGKLLLKGMQQFKANQLEPALQTFQKALIIFRNIKNRKGEAGALLGLGLVYSGLQDYSQGIDYYKQSLVIAREIKDSELEAILQLESHKTEAERLLNQGAQQLKANQLKLALQSVQKALIIYRDIKNRRGEGFALAFLGSVYSGLQDYPQAINYYKQSLVIAREIKDSELEALVQLELADAKLGSNPQKAEADRLLNQGIELYQKSQFKAALQSWEQALQIYREIKDRDGEGDILGNLGNVYLSLGEYKKAIELFQQALAIFKQIGDKAGVGRTLGNLGNAYYFLGEYKKAIEFHQQDLAIAKQIGDKAGVVRALGNLGLAYLYLGEYKKAIEFHQKSLAIAKQIGDKASEGGVLGNLGLAYHFLGDYQKAIEFHQQHLAIAKQIGDKAGVGRSLGNLGIAYNSLGDYQKAIELYQQLLAIAKQISDKLGEGTALGNLGTAYYKLGEYKKAIDLYQQHLAIAKQISDRESEGRALGNLGNVYLSLGEYKKAIDLYQQHLAIAKQIGKKAGEGLALGSLGNAYYSLGEYQKAIEYDQQYLAIAKQIGDKAGEGNALNNLGVTFFKSGNLAEAQRVLKQGIEVLKYQHSRQKKDEFKISIFEEQAKTYRILQQVYIAQNKPDGALEVAESGRARAFVDSLASRIFSNNKQLDKSTEPPTINQIKQIAKSQNSTFVQYSIIVDEFKIAGKRQVKESELYIWVIKPTGEVTFRKADLKYLWEEENTTLSKLVSTTRKSLGVGDDERSIFDVKVKNPVNEKIQRESLQKLHQLLVQPIADLLPTDPNQRVTFVPQE